MDPVLDLTSVDHQPRLCQLAHLFDANGDDTFAGTGDLGERTVAQINNAAIDVRPPVINADDDSFLVSDIDHGEFCAERIVAMRYGKTISVKGLATGSFTPVIPVSDSIMGGRRTGKISPCWMKAGSNPKRCKN